MASLRYSAADESEDTLNSFTSHTVEGEKESVGVICKRAVAMILTLV